MKLGSLRYLLKEGVRSLWQNRMMALASIFVLVSCLLLTGGAYLVYTNVEDAFGHLAKQNLVMAFAEEGFDPAGAEALRTEIENLDNVDTAKYISAESLLRQQSGIYSDDILDGLLAENPYPETFEITLKDIGRQAETVESVNALVHIDSVSSNDDVAQKIVRMRDIALFVCAWIIALLMLVSLFIIANTIKLTVYNRRLEISIMKSVGATNAFVRFPFAVEGVLLGMLAGLAAYGITVLVYGQLEKMIRGNAFQSGLISFGNLWVILLVGYLAIGILMGMLGSAVSTGKYLKDEGGLSAVI